MYLQTYDDCYVSRVNTWTSVYCTDDRQIDISESNDMKIVTVPLTGSNRVIIPAGFRWWLDVNLHGNWQAAAHGFSGGGNAVFKNDAKFFSCTATYGTNWIVGNSIGLSFLNTLEFVDPDGDYWPISMTGVGRAIDIDPIKFVATYDYTLSSYMRINIQQVKRVHQMDPYDPDSDDYWVGYTTIQGSLAGEYQTVSTLGYACVIIERDVLAVSHSRPLELPVSPATEI